MSIFKGKTYLAKNLKRLIGHILSSVLIIPAGTFYGIILISMLWFDELCTIWHDIINDEYNVEDTGE